jgi:thiol-disulfide isomerase/thioredoxin
MLLEFYGRECPPCMRVKILIEKLEEKEKIEVKKYEVWHDEKNAELMQKYAEDKCLGVPFLFNTETKSFVCGLVDYKKLVEWAGIKRG